jgi:2-methylcitrate dehydratase PrpD
MAQEIHAKLSTPLEQIASIGIETYGPGYEIVKEMNPETPYQAKFSLAYCVAVALLEGRAGLEQFSPERIRSAPIRALIERSEVTVEEDLTAKYPAAWPVRLTVKLKDGTVLTGAADYPRGNPENPVPTSALEEKFLDLVGPRFGAQVARRALDAVASVAACGNMSQVFCDVLPA